MATRRFPMNKGDLTPAIQAQLFNPDGSAMNLAGKTVKFVMGKVGQAVKINLKTMNHLSDPAGIVEYQWAGAETAETGDFRAQVVVNDVERFPKEGYLIIAIQDTV